ncbi:MAG: hypothetical protein P8129_10285, partial [Anaerolineae bacterium]
TYTAEIGPLSPLVRRELARLVARYPQAAAWDYAFAEAVRANVRRLSYVEKVLEGQARRLANPTQGERNGTDRPYRGQNDRNRRDEAARPAPRRLRGGCQPGSAPTRTAGPGRGVDPRTFDPVAVVEGRQSFDWHAATEEQMRAVQRAAAAVEPLDYREVLGLSSRPGVECA